MSTVRRSQLIAPFGVGAIHVLKGARAVVTAGLDFWFLDRSTGNPATGEQLSSVRILEPRLQKQLDVSHFRMPPGPESRLPGQPDLVVPLFRFPTWHVCPRCGLMRREKLTARGFFECQVPACNKEQLIQVRFASSCDAGHLQDFPWREWVHRDRNPVCKGDLHYQAGGSGSLDDISIRCSGCSKQRTLAGAMSGSYGRDDEENVPWSALTSRLLSTGNSDDKNDSDPTEKFPCFSGRVWLGERSGGTCDRPLRAILINATNVHYAKISSALWIPPTGADRDVHSLREILDDTKYRTRIRLRRGLGDSDARIAEDLQGTYPVEFGKFPKETLLLALQDGIETEAEVPSVLKGEEVLRFPEYGQLQVGREVTTTRDDLVVRVVQKKPLNSCLPTYLVEKIECLSLVDKLRETRALYGFARLLAEKPLGALPYQQMLWKEWPTQRKDRWLPANVVYGEGIFIRFTEAPLQAWEKSEAVLKHIAPLQERYRIAERSAGKAVGKTELRVAPRYILLHTLAHLLMRRLTFDCGYGSSSLRERLYVSDASEALMAGILIYTASGDSEGSMGGLVRMGEPENFARILAGAIDDAKWCSSDPVCTEAGNMGGQGTDGLNIAACHCCALMPETSCEQFNRLLDRQLLVGTVENPRLAFLEPVKADCTRTASSERI
jgi:hypothetical protein